MTAALSRDGARRIIDIKSLRIVTDGKYSRSTCCSQELPLQNGLVIINLRVGFVHKFSVGLKMVRNNYE